MRTDAEIMKDVENELRWSPEIDASDIAINVRNGTVQLAGFVKRYGDTLAAETAAKRIVGVVGLANDIEVRLPDWDQRPDPDITRDAVSALHLQQPLSQPSIKVLVHNGWVTLEGTVEWYYQRQAAETSVRGLKGVKGVSNRIQLNPQATASQVKRQIEEAFKRHAALDAATIRVEATGGNVTLRGAVRSWVERKEAEDAAWAAPGVTSVDDQISVCAA